MKEIKIQVPDGKRAEWKNGVLTLVDEPQVDNRPVTERIKTFEDACNELERMANKGDETAANLLADYESNANNILTPQTRAYMRLSIITYALNEGWEPQFTTDEYRYFPWFRFYTQAEIDQMDEEDKKRVVGRASSNANAYGGCVYANANYASSYSGTDSGARLAFKTRELAEYAGKQFTEEYADYSFKPRTGEELNGKSEDEEKPLIDFSDDE